MAGRGDAAGALGMCAVGCVTYGPLGICPWVGGVVGVYSGLDAHERNDE